MYRLKRLDINKEVLQGRSSTWRKVRDGLSNRVQLLCSCLSDGPSALHTLLELSSLSGSIPSFAFGRQCVSPLIFYQFYQRKTVNRAIWRKNRGSD